MDPRLAPRRRATPPAIEHIRQQSLLGPSGHTPAHTGQTEYNEARGDLPPTPRTPNVREPVRAHSETWKGNTADDGANNEHMTESTE